MCMNMSKTIQEERYRWIKPIIDKKIKIVDLARVCPYSERSLKRWLANFRKKGMKGLIPKSTKPKSHPLETPIRIKERIIELRKETGLCAKKLEYILVKKDINIHHRTIGKIIKDEGLTRRYRTKKVKVKYLKIPLQPGELVEIDVKYVPKKLNELRFYQFTAIDKASRWRYMKIYDDTSNMSSIKFLKKLIEIAPFRIRAIKTDNGSNFTNRYTGYLKSSDPFNPRLHPLDLLCQKLRIIHYLIDPGKPAQNGCVERSHRTDQEHFYDKISFKSLEELQYKMKLWIMYYNDLEHISLDGKTPNEFLKKHNNLINTKVTDVCS